MQELAGLLPLVHQAPMPLVASLLLPHVASSHLLAGVCEEPCTKRAFTPKESLWALKENNSNWLGNADEYQLLYARGKQELEPPGALQEGQIRPGQGRAYRSFKGAKPEPRKLNSSMWSS